jgi:ABC1 atypical kinase-like domain
MKGVMMKIGQMASYIGDGLSPAVRQSLARLQDSVPPMSPALAAAAAEELDYRREAASQRLMAAYYHGHPTIAIPPIIDELSTRKVMTSELSGGVRFAGLASWPQHERDLAAETIYRFVFRSLYDVRAFTGDPHPGNYLFQRGGRVTFLDFGLVRHFTPAELQPLLQMARTLCVEHDPGAFRASLENAGFLRPGAPLGTQAITDHLAVFYDTIREPGPRTITSDYASSVARRFFDLRSPVAGYLAIPRPHVILQRINLGLPAVLGELSATADWRAISEEIRPFTQGPAATPIGQAEARWRARRQAAAA